MEGTRTAFVGRRWVLARLSEWLGTGSRFFHLVGEPGSGKTALSRELVHLSRDLPEPDAEFPRIRRGFIDASHFCSARDRRMVNPLTFAESIGAQLAASSPVYMAAMLKAIGAPTTSVQQHVGTADNSTVVGVLIQELNARGPSPEDAFNRLVREPLEALCRAEPSREVVILVDALDESLAYRGDVGIVPLLSQADDLPATVRFVLTSRPVPEIDRKLAPVAGDVERLTLSASEWDANNRDDIASYIASRLESDPQIAPSYLALGAKATAAAEGLNHRANGNFLYAHFLLDAVAHGQWKLEEFADAPASPSTHAARGMDRLYVLYMESLQRVIDIGKGDWQEQYAPIMEALSAAQETLPRDRLKAFAAQRESAFRANLDNLRQFVETVAPASGEGAFYRLYHQSFTEFLRASTIETGDGTLDNPFHLTAFDSHARIADCLAAAHGSDWSACDDGYALRYAAAHFAGAAGADTAQERHDRSRALVELVTSSAFQKAHRARLDDPLALRGDLERALGAVAKNDHPHGPPLVVRAALALHALRREHARPDTMFDLARAGDVDGAERRLALFSADPGWRQAVSLLIAWLAAPVDLPAARATRDRIVHDGVEPMLELLVARLDVDLSGGASPTLPDLGPPPGEHEILAILDRLAGNPTTGIEPLDLERMHAEVGSGSVARPAPSYLAESDGPRLVSFVLHSANGRGDELFSRYVAAQASNGYEYYRNRSLWALIAPVLAHPDAEWTRRRLVELSSGALSTSIVHFGQALPLTVLALQGRAGDANAAAEFDRQRDDAMARADTTSPWRQGDPWSHQLRRLIALAEIESIVRGRQDVAADLLNRAMSLPFGFAGFNAKARLTLSESLRFLQPADSIGLESALTMARGSAHNVQDHVFCARVTSVVEAMRLTWRATVDADTLVVHTERFIRDPLDPDFAGRHEVGEQFEMRADRQHRLVIPDWARDASTLRALSKLYDFPLSEFLQFSASKGWRADDALPAGTVVPAPDPKFPPLLAARFAGDALAASSLPAARRTRLIQLVVPVAARDYTALDVTLSRLLLASLPADSASLAHLAESVARYVPAEMFTEAAPLIPGLPA